MDSGRVQGVVALAGLSLSAAAVVIAVVGPELWWKVLATAGVTSLLASLVMTGRTLLSEARTLRSNMGRAGRAQRDQLGQQGRQLGERLQHLDARISETSQRLDGLMARIESIGADTGTATADLAARLQAVQEELGGLGEEVGMLQDAPVRALWERIGPGRAPGVLLLAMTERDASWIRRTEDASVDIHSCAPGADETLPAPALSGHDVGALVVDLDLIAQSRVEQGWEHAAEWEQVLRWLRPEVPVAGFTRSPQLLALHTAALHQLSGGRLLPVPVSEHAAMFVLADTVHHASPNDTADTVSARPGSETA